MAVNDAETAKVQVRHGHESPDLLLGEVHIARCKVLPANWWSQLHEAHMLSWLSGWVRLCPLFSNKKRPMCKTARVVRRFKNHTFSLAHRRCPTMQWTISPTQYAWTHWSKLLDCGISSGVKICMYMQDVQTCDETRWNTIFCAVGDWHVRSSVLWKVLALDTVYKSWTIP